MCYSTDSFSMVSYNDHTLFECAEDFTLRCTLKLMPSVGFGVVLETLFLFSYPQPNGPVSAHGLLLILLGVPVHCSVVLLKSKLL